MVSNRSTTETLLNPSVFGSPGTVGQVVAGSLAGVGGGGSGADTSQLTTQMQQLETVAQAETETIQSNTQAINQNTTQLGDKPTGASAASQAGSALESGLSPLISGIVGLFGGGGGNKNASVPSAYLMPPSVNVNAGMSEAAPTQPFAVDYAAGGSPRASPSNSGGAGAAQITVQVQAMDSQSFLDHSSDIALAVRQAMLQSSVLNDVIREV
jgi:hypothetical protein